MSVDIEENQEEALAEDLRSIEAGPPRSRTLSSLYGLEELAKDQNRSLVRIDSLPGWPGSDSDGDREGHGLGEKINAAIGGGIAPGTIIGVGAAAAKSGKTAFVHQLADGLALRAAQVLAGKAQGPLTPLIILSEMDARALSWRTLARWTGYPANLFRAGKDAVGMFGYNENMQGEARKALEEGSLLDCARSLTRILSQTKNGKGLVEELKTTIKELRGRYKKFDVLPIVMIDPIQRFMSTGKGSANESMDEFANALNEETRAGDWCVLLTSDATKATAMGTTKQDNPGASAAEEGAAVFRGSYTLQHILDTGLYLRPVTEGSKGDNDTRVLEVVSVLSRWAGPGKPTSIDFHGPTMRFSRPRGNAAPSSTYNPPGRQ